MLAAMNGGLDGDLPVVICYQGIFLRDHWEDVTAQPWWYAQSPDLSARLAVEVDLQDKLDLDWISCSMNPPRDWRETHAIRGNGGKAYLEDLRTGVRTELQRPPVGGNKISMLDKPRIGSREDVRNKIKTASKRAFLDDGRLDYVHLLRERFGPEKFLYASVGSPFWNALMSYFGLRGMLAGLYRSPELVKYVLEEITRAQIEKIRAYHDAGVDGYWIEECLTSAGEISRSQYCSFVQPSARMLIEEIRKIGGKSIHYVCGDVRDRLDLIVEAGPDCISLEESKKNFEIDISWIDDLVGGRCCIFGNLDSIGILQNGSREALSAEIRRQIEVGRRHGRFVMSLGSPVTPGTPVSRVREYVDISREESM